MSAPPRPLPAVADVRLVSGRLAPDELAAIAVVVSTMSVTSRLEAEQRDLTAGLGSRQGAWSDPAHCHPHSHRDRRQVSPIAWQYSDR